MTFLSAIASGIEDAVGETAKSITYVAGKDLGRRFSENAGRTDDIEAALLEVRRILEERHCLWRFEPFKPTSREHLITHNAEGDEIMLVFRDCMIRQSLFVFGHAQKGSLCNMMFGFFAGALENITGRQADLAIVHAGENACYKRLTLRLAGSGASTVEA
jgi:predicted hydrocarbon binding protein